MGLPHNFEGFQDEKALCARAKINLLETTLVLWNFHKQKLYMNYIFGSSFCPIFGRMSHCATHTANDIHFIPLHRNSQTSSQDLGLFINILHTTLSLLFRIWSSSSTYSSFQDLGLFSNILHTTLKLFCGLICGIIIFGSLNFNTSGGLGQKVNQI